MIYKNNKFLEEDIVDETKLQDGLTLYEVIRIFDHAPVFISDNINRLNNSIKKSRVNVSPEDIDLKKIISLYLNKIPLNEGNLKYLLHFHPDGNHDEYLEEIPHHYPCKEQYEKGVSVSVLNAERENPEIKYLNPELRNKADEFIRQNKLYEVILVSHDGYITEGSRSNIFFIKQAELYTAPDFQVLPGTARTRVIHLAESLSIRVNKIPIPIKDISSFDAAFITGTSPMVLPIKNIGSNEYDCMDRTLRTIMKEYFNMIKE